MSNVTELPTDPVRHKRQLDTMVAGVKKRFDEGNLASLAVVFYDRDGQPFTWVSDSMSLAEWAYGIQLLTADLQKLLGKVHDDE